MASKMRWADLPLETRDRLERLKVAKAMAARLERQRRRSLREQLKREGTYVNLERVNCSRIQGSALAKLKLCCGLKFELDKLTDRRRQPLNQRQILELGITELEAMLRRQIQHHLFSPACFWCGYSLAGLNHADQSVRCPECGKASPVALGQPPISSSSSS